MSSAFPVDQTSLYPSGTINKSYLIDRVLTIRHTLMDPEREKLALPSAALAFHNVVVDNDFTSAAPKRRGDEATNAPKRLKVDPVDPSVE